MRRASLPMYNLPPMRPDNAALWDRLRPLLLARGVADVPELLDVDRAPVPEAIGGEILFSQVCGYPLLKRFRGQGIPLATPCYDMAGCNGPNHSACFMVRRDEAATELAAMRGRVFGCNSIHSNSGMNLPRLSLARIAGGRPFFAAVVWTHGHIQSLQALIERRIDLCAIDCVTWGFVERHRPDLAAEVRVLDWTVDSPSLPFVTASTTAPRDVEAMRDALDDLMADPAAAAVRQALRLTGVARLELGAYAKVLDYEAEAARLGYAALR